MQTPTNLNDQHAWGGQPFHRIHSESSASVTEQDQTTMVVHGRQDAPVHPLSQAGVIASSSDNLFHPVPNVPSSHIFNLPTVLSPSRHHVYNRPQAFPYHSPFSSYTSGKHKIT